LRGAASTLAPLDDVVTRGIAAIRSGAHIEPRGIWKIGLRLFEKARQSNFRRLLFPLLAAWLRREWRRIIAEEGFRLSRPRQTVPSIEADVASDREDEAFIAALLLSSAEAVGSPLAAAYEGLLRDVARGGTSAKLSEGAESVPVVEDGEAGLVIL
jgi:hypothetical protein